MNSYQHRKSKSVITVLDAAGVPMAGQKIRAKLVNHEFLFGTGAFWAVDLLKPDQSPQEREHLERTWESWSRLFNYGTLPFYQGRYEKREGETLEIPTLRASRFMKENGKTVKGHPLCWHTVSALWLLEKSNEEVLANQLGRIRREMSAFSGSITLWDVINEVVIMPIFEKEENAITRLCQEMGRVPLVKAVFDQAKAVDPDATLLLNDFNTTESYRQLIEDCLEAGVPIDVLGIQSHQHRGFWGLDKLYEVLARFESFGMPMHFTENTIISGDLMPKQIVDLNDFQVKSWPSNAQGEDRQARDLISMLDVLFAHPQVEAFTSWNFTDDGAWLGAPAGLVRKDGSHKPSYDAMEQRILHDWHTDITVMTDENGRFVLDGFRGEYEVSVDKKNVSLVLSRDNAEQTVIMK